MRKSFLFVLAFLAGSTLMAHATQAESMNCDDDDRPPSTHNYSGNPSDVLQPRHLELTRPFAGNGRLEVHVCNANLLVRTARDVKEIRLTVDLNNQLDGHSTSDYIHTLRIQPDNGVIQLKFQKGVHATVTLTMPMGPDSDNEFNLGRGDLDFNAIGSAGVRQINVGMGHMQLLVDGDKSYSKMSVNVGMGSLHDHRPGGHGGHFVVSKDYAGSGAGSLDINVGMGSLDIRND
jgi:hypothetical protein